MGRSNQTVAILSLPDLHLVRCVGWDVALLTAIDGSHFRLSEISAYYDIAGILLRRRHKRRDAVSILVRRLYLLADAFPFAL